MSQSGSRPAALGALLLLLVETAVPSAQPLTVTTADDAVKVRAPGFTFLKGAPLERLKDGRAVRLELTMLVLPQLGGTPVAAARRIIAISYDLWEERFAAATVEARPRRISHLTSASAEAWCLDQLAIPLDALRSLGAEPSFFVRLEYRILDGDAAAAANEEGSPFTLQTLIDALSRRRSTESIGDAVEGGPFRLPRRGGATALSLPP